MPTWSHNPALLQLEAASWALLHIGAGAGPQNGGDICTNQLPDLGDLASVETGNSKGVDNISRNMLSIFLRILRKRQQRAPVLLAVRPLDAAGGHQPLLQQPLALETHQRQPLPPLLAPGTRAVNEPSRIFTVRGLYTGHCET